MIQTEDNPKVNILLVDDHPENLLSLEAILGELGENLVKAHSGREALKCLLEREFALILLDVQMPELDGFETANLIQEREKSRHTPIIFLTAAGTSATFVAQGYSAGAVDYITKPFVPEILKAKVAVFVSLFKKTQALARSEAMLRSLNETLEDRVMEQTKAYRESNQRLQEALAELKRTQEQIIQEERLRAFGQMASGIAHDFNNALSPILGFTEILLLNSTNLEDREKVRHHLHMINTAAQDAAGVVRRLREFYRKREENEVYHPIDLRLLIEQAIALTEPKWKNQALASGTTISIQTDLKELPHILGSETELREVLTNLILNAVDAMPEGGIITITAHAVNGQISLRVSDSGTGMSEAVRQRCFDPFFTTKGERGTGLGLPMVAGIIKRHGGDIQIETREGRGTTFVMTFPVERAGPQEARDVSPAKYPLNLHILLVEDEPEVREVLEECLRSEGHTVEAAANGREALEKFHAGQFDLVITDRGMPMMSGDKLAAAIKQLAPNKPVIMLTGFGDLMEASEDKPRGVDLVLSKPVALGDVRRAISKAMQSPAP